MRTRPSALALAIVFAAFATYQTQGQITIRPPAKEISSDGGGGYILTSGTGTWTAKTTADWISIQPRTSGEADESCIYVVKTNKSADPRDAQIMINDNVHTVIQYGIPSESQAKDNAVSPERAMIESRKTILTPIEPLSQPADKSIEAIKDGVAPPSPVSRDDNAHDSSVSSSSSPQYNTQPAKLASSKYAVPTKSSEFMISGDFVVPGQDDDWDKGVGATARLVFWQNSTLGYALVIGAQKWDVNDEIYSGGQYLGSGIAYGYAMGLDGDATMFPLGVSGMYNIPFGPTTSLTLEGGLRYVIINSNVKFIEAEVLGDSYGNRLTDARSYDVEYDNGILGVINAYFNMDISKGFRLFAGVGYQFDLVKGRVEVGGLDINYKNELKAFQASAGVAWDF
jgi:hypothetical protein